MQNQAKQRQPSGGIISFFNGFLRHPQQVGSIVPSSRYLKKHIIELADISVARFIVELGPGTGGTTHSFLASMRPDANLLAVEISPDFSSQLKQINDPRLTVHHGDAHELIRILASYRMPSPDVVISGIPFSTMPLDFGQEIVAAIGQSLANRGRFVAYQFRDRVEQLGNSVFGPVHKEFEFLNIPPIHLYCWHKNSEMKQ